MKIEWDQEKNIIKVGNVAFDSYKSFRNARSWAVYVCRENKISIPEKTNHQEFNKKLGDVFGCSISVLFKKFNGLQKKAFIVPVYHLYKYVNEFKPWKKNINPHTISNLLENKSILDEVYNDGLYNLIPLVAAYKKSPKELKQIYGGSWKTVSKNSVNKNKLLVRFYNGSNEKKIKEIGSYDFPSTLLSQGCFAELPTIDYIKKNCKGLWKDRDKVLREARIYSDTKRMAEQINIKFNQNWSSRRMHEEHNRMSREITARKYSPTPFEWTKDLPQTIEHEGFVATLLNSRLAIAEEGTAMGHCVARYSEMVAEGNYLVYNVTKDGERKSTIGLYKKDRYKTTITSNSEITKEWVVQQHYGRYNELVKDENEKAIAVQLVTQINKVIKCSSMS